ncbi:MAG TPA: hypothetical protein VF829_03225 [Candidatus Paceibacterota bacterium]
MAKLIERFIVVFSQAGIWILTLTAVGLLFLIFKNEGLAGVWATIKVDVAKVVVKFALMLVIFFVITGSMNHLVRNNPGEFRKWASGEHGTLSMVLVSIVMPGPAGGQQLRDAWKLPETDKATLILCLVAMMGGSVTMFMFRSQFIGPLLTTMYGGIFCLELLLVWVLGKAYTLFVL